MSDIRNQAWERRRLRRERGDRAEGEQVKHGLSLADRVYRGLKDEIITCRLAPGSMILESSLAERFGVSKAPVREALGYLSREGLVEVLPKEVQNNEGGAKCLGWDQTISQDV